MGEPTLQTPIGIATLKPRSLVSALIGRFQFLQRAGLTFGGKRDLYEAFGYARELTLKDFRDRYSRDGIAARLIDCYPKATWREGAYLQEDEDPEKTTPFEQAWEDFDKRLGIWSMFERVDKLARLSAYSILLIGTPDGNLEEELPRGKSLDQIIFLSAFAGGGGPGRTGEAMYVDATIQEFVRDPTDPRFGLPSAYQLSRVDATAPAMQRIVHWSRIIHVAEGLLDNDVFGTPQLLDVWNRFDDLDKVTGGGAEAFFQRANKGLNLNLDKDVEMQEEDRKKLASEVDDYVHGMTRILKTRAMTVQELGSDVANFSQPADAIITQIAGAKGIPKRILLGSEMGQLASGQDRDNWDTQVKDRRTSYAGPRLVRPFVDRLIEYGYLPTPKEYIVVWPEVSNLTEAEKADGANKWANTNSTAGVTIFTPEEIRDHWYQMDPLTPEQLEAAKAQKDAEAPPEPVVMDPMGKLVKPKPGMGKPPFMGGKKPADGKKPAFGRRAAEEGEEIDPLDTLVDSLEAALEAGDMDFVSSCLGIHAFGDARGLGGPGSGDKEGHPFRGNQYTDVGMKWTKNEAGNWVDERGREQWADKSGPPKSPEYMFHLMKAKLSQANHRNAAFILPDGTMLAKRHRSQPHFSAAEEAGVHFSALLKAGVVRVAEPGAAEVSVPITEIQAQLLIDSALYAQGSPRAGTLFGRPGELYIDVDLTGAGPGSGRHATKVFDPERTTADALRAWISHQFAEHEERRQPYRAAGGPGSGDKLGHPFRGNQYTDEGMQWTQDAEGTWTDNLGREQVTATPPKSPEYMFHLLKEKLSIAKDFRNTGFILPDGTMLAKQHREQTHWEATAMANLKLYDLMKVGVVRMAEPGAAEVLTPITDIQAQLLIESAAQPHGSEYLAFGNTRAGGELFIDVNLGSRDVTKTFDSERITADGLRAWIKAQFDEQRQQRAAGGPGSGDKEGHDFHGNQWVDKSGRAIRGPLQRLVAEASEGRLSEYELRRELAEELERDKHGLVGRSIDWPTQPKPPSTGSLEWKIQGLLRDHAAGLVDNAELRHEIKRLIGEPGWTARDAGDFEGHPFRGNQWTKGSLLDRMNRSLRTADYWSDTKFILPDGTRKSFASPTHADAAKRLGTTLTDVLKSGAIRVSAPGSFEIGAPITDEMAALFIESTSSPQSTVGLHIDIADVDGSGQHGHARPFGVAARATSKSFDPERATAEGIRRWVNAQFGQPVRRAAQEPIEEIKALEARGDAVLLFATTDREAADAHAYGREGTAIFEFDVPDDTDLAALEEDLGMRIYVVGEARGLGGPGSGHFGHAGRPGHVGGSSKGTGPTQDEIDAEILAKGSSGFPPKDPWGKDTQMMYSDGHGNYTPERQALHDAIVRKILKGTTPVDDPSAWFVGGGMAAGKSTLTNTLTWDNTVMVNPDVIRDQLPEWQETLAAALSKGEQNASVSFTHEEASDISREVIMAARRESRNMMLDAVGDSSFERLAEKIAMMGPNVDAIYVTVPIALAQQRADHRARTTDRRFVLPEFMAAAHAMVSKIYPKAVAGGVFRSTQLFETSIQGYPKWIASSKGKELTIFDHDLWDEFIAKGGKG